MSEVVVVVTLQVEPGREDSPGGHDLAVKTHLLIAGEAVAGAGTPLDVEDPATGTILHTLATASAEQIDAALAAAREAQPGWERTPAAERAELLHAVAAWLREHAEDIAVAMTREGGKPLLENRDEVGWTAACFDFYAELDGNACVCKPSELTPLSTLMLAPAFAGFPPGVVSLLAGAGDVGGLLVADERVDCVAFTGSVETGKAIARACVGRLARLHLELGGKDPFIVCPDVADDIAVAARGGAWAAYLNAGQVCTSAERFYVHTDVYEPFVEAFVEHAATLRVGDPMDPATDVGPMASSAQRAKVLAHMDDAVAAGAQVLVGGQTRAPGHYLTPAVVTGAPGSTQLLREETFGPVAPIVRVASLDEAIAHANATRFGLGANVYTRDLRTVVRCMREIKAGTVWFNDPLTDNDAGPFGGFKQSGIGRELGVEGLEAFLETKHVHIESVLEAKDWWYPYGG